MLASSPLKFDFLLDPVVYCPIKIIEWQATGAAIDAFEA